MRRDRTCDFTVDTQRKLSYFVNRHRDKLSKLEIILENKLFQKLKLLKKLITKKCSPRL